MSDTPDISTMVGVQANWRPIPDPTDLTTAALMREVGYLRNLLQIQIDGSEKLVGSLRDSDVKFETERDRRITEVASERDRRLTEVATEREKALKIKEEADKEALRLDREIRQFKDEKAGAVTAQAVTSLEQRLVPIDRYVAAQQGRSDGIGTSLGVVVTVLTLLIAFAVLLSYVLIHG
jgi:hypothetical protein